MVCSITHDPLDFGKIMHNEKRVESFCGTTILGSITTGRYLELQNEATGKECRSWQAMYERSKTETPGDGDESITCAVRRKLESPYSRIQMKTGQVYLARVGFNVYESEMAEKRLTGREGPRLEMMLFDQA